MFISKFVRSVAAVALLIFLFPSAYLSSFKPLFLFVSISHFNLLAQSKHIIEITQ